MLCKRHSTAGHSVGLRQASRNVEQAPQSALEQKTSCVECVGRLGLESSLAYRSKGVENSCRFSVASTVGQALLISILHRSVDFSAASGTWTWIRGSRILNTPEGSVTDKSLISDGLYQLMLKTLLITLADFYGDLDGLKSFHRYEYLEESTCVCKLPGYIKLDYEASIGNQTRRGGGIHTSDRRCRDKLTKWGILFVTGQRENHCAAKFGYPLNPRRRNPTPACPLRP
ncbi:hypothetical protein RRG08_014599 [Elysia crispata]|uniref:Uncharacterized protein n=1 Tax=Elysia crispata TaxID=231223 RepID=A0AAE0Z2N1_9GAST|nr:hypothetical protein RRG08_014599 [Elysia crispata]